MQWSGNHSSLVTGCDLHPGTSTAVSGCDSGMLVHWDTRTGNKTRTLNGMGITHNSYYAEIHRIVLC